MIRKVEISGVNTANLKTLTDAQNQEMIKRIKNGEEHLKDEFILHNLKLVLSVVQRFSSRNENMDDLFQVGCIGLIKAVDNFDPSYNVKVSTYAVPMIIGEIRRHLRDGGIIRVSRSLKDVAYKALKLKEEYQDLNLTNQQIADILEVKLKTLNLALDAIAPPCSLFEKISNDKGDSMYILDNVKDEKNLEDNWMEKISITEAVKNLNDKEKEIINKRFYQGKTQIEVAEEIGISQAQVSRLEKNALFNIKAKI